LLRREVLRESGEPLMGRKVKKGELVRNYIQFSSVFGIFGGEFHPTGIPLERTLTYWF